MNNIVLTKIIWIKDEAALHINGINHMFYLQYKMGEIIKC